MTLNENTIRELLDASTPGQWTVEEDDWEEVIVGNDRGHRMVWGDQVRFEFEAGNPKADPQLVALAPELAADWLRMRDELTDFRNLQHEVSINSAFFSRARREAAELTRDRIDRILEGDSQND